MEKMESFDSFNRFGKHQCQSILEACQKFIKTKMPLVNNNIIYNLNNINTCKWKELSKVQKAVFFFDYIVDEKWVAITLRFSLKFMENCAHQPKLTDFIRRRLNENFKNRLGYVPQYLFSIEFTFDSFHIHGVIEPETNLDLIEKILKTTAFSRKYKQNSMPESCKLRCKQIYDAHGWGCYVLKRSNHPNFDIYICMPLIKRIRKRYHEVLNKKYSMKLNAKKGS